jgi:hypothetical protein
MTDEKLTELAELTAKATPGPWCCDVFGCVTAAGDEPVPQDEHDGRFIAACRTALPELLAEVQELTAEVQELTAELRLAREAAKGGQ